jgi:hypothetical protein
VRQAGSSEVAALGNLPATYGYNSPDCPVCTELSGEPTVGRAICAGHVAEPTARRGHRTVRCAPDCPVSQRSAGPTVGRAICAGHVAEPTARREHQTIRCAPDMSGAPTAPKSATVGCAILGRKSGTGQCPVCTGLSGAPVDRRQDQPSQIALNGS